MKLISSPPNYNQPRLQVVTPSIQSARLAQAHTPQADAQRSGIFGKKFWLGAAGISSALLVWSNHADHQANLAKQKIAAELEKAYTHSIGNLGIPEKFTPEQLLCNKEFSLNLPNDEVHAIFSDMPGGRNSLSFFGNPKTISELTPVGKLDPKNTVLDENSFVNTDNYPQKSTQVWGDTTPALCNGRNIKEGVKVERVSKIDPDDFGDITGQIKYHHMQDLKKIGSDSTSTSNNPISDTFKTLGRDFETNGMLVDVNQK